MNSRVREIRRILNLYDYIVEECEDAKAVADFIDRKMNVDKTLDFFAFADSFINGMKDNGSRPIKQCMLTNLRCFLDSDILPVGKINSIGFALGFKENLSHHMSRHGF